MALNGLDVIRQLDQRHIDMAISWFAAVPEALVAPSCWRRATSSSFAAVIRSQPVK